MVPPVISFIILTWNSKAFLAACFESIIRKCLDERISFEVIVIDNGSGDGSFEIVKEYQNRHCGIFHLIPLDSNCGTTYPRNLGLKQARGEYFCILDSDTQLRKGSLTAILDRLRSETNIGIIAPQLLLPDGSVQNSVKLFPSMMDKILKIPAIFMNFRAHNDDFYDDFPFNNEREVDCAISACWFFRRDLLEKVGYLDEKFFYAPEDVDYSLRVWKRGLTILYFPLFTVFHHTQQISHKKPLSKTSLFHLLGLLYYYGKHGGWIIRPQYRKLC